jgi:hypothetical protein
MSFLLNPFYYAFSLSFIEKYSRFKNDIVSNNIITNEEPIVTIDINFDNILIIDDYTEICTTNNELLNNLITKTTNIIKRATSCKSILSEFEIEYSMSEYNFNSEVYEKLNLSVSIN